MGYLPGVRVRDLKMLPDERGFFCELLRGDWDDLLGDEPIVQANLSVNYPGIIRAWHQHVRGKVDYHVVLKGAMKICAYDAREESETRGHLSEVVLNSERLQVVRIPGHYWHGVKNVGSEPSTTIYFHNKLYDYVSEFDERYTVI
ncbi:MAG: dTDP-4-dehydrorhamnose 3,5-epimerase family protein, partial [Thermoplasmata archaeon]